LAEERLETKKASFHLKKKTQKKRVHFFFCDAFKALCQSAKKSNKKKMTLKRKKNKLLTTVKDATADTSLIFES
jgi:predicted GH43/DUF377 family glycosyl hydrolase